MVGETIDDGKAVELVVEVETRTRKPCLLHLRKLSVEQSLRTNDRWKLSKTV
jgi:hypothetical protein